MDEITLLDVLSKTTLEMWLIMLMLTLFSFGVLVLIIRFFYNLAYVDKKEISRLNSQNELQKAARKRMSNLYRANMRKKPMATLNKNKKKRTPYFSDDDDDEGGFDGEELQETILNSIPTLGETAEFKPITFDDTPISAERYNNRNSFRDLPETNSHNVRDDSPAQTNQNESSHSHGNDSDSASNDQSSGRNDD